MSPSSEIRFCELAAVSAPFRSYMASNDTVPRLNPHL